MTGQLTDAAPVTDLTTAVSLTQAAHATERPWTAPYSQHGTIHQHKASLSHEKLQHLSRAKQICTHRASNAMQENRVINHSSASETDTKPYRSTRCIIHKEGQAMNRKEGSADLAMHLTFSTHCAIISRFFWRRSLTEKET